ncbi:hypothetical protein, partial [Aromatoleum evansii]|uniref:hypothetical protein n=1 Tax=Aromatoleum evansii TaxID=59406 RepID=UPI00145F13A3
MIAASAQPIRFTVFHAQRPRRLSKAFRLAADGTLARESGGVLVSGQAQQMAVKNLSEFSEILTSLTPAHAAAFGIARFAAVRIVPKREVNHPNLVNNPSELPIVSRTREHFAWPAGPGLMMLDYDPAPGCEALSPQAWRDILYGVWPQLQHAPHLWRPSASSCLENTETGEVLRAITGQRLYIVVADANDVPRVGQTLVDRLWLAGHGRFDVSRSGALLERTVVDAAVWQPERLDFCGGAQCEPPLAQRQSAAVILNGDTQPIDTAATLPDLSAAERAELAALKRALQQEPDLQNEVSLAHAGWVEERLTSWQSRHPEADAEIGRKLLLRAVRDKRLMGDFELVLDDGERVSVGAMLDAPERYHNRRCADPLEPDYQRDARIAWINLRNAGRPYIYSHAHGGTRYSLHRPARTLRLIGGELHRLVRSVLDLMRLDGAVFDRGGELVQVSPRGTVYPVTAEWLTVHLSALINFERLSQRNHNWYAVDCPLDLAKRVLAMRGSYGLPKLRAVLTAPVLTLDVRVLDRDGHDPQTGLLLILNEPEQAAIPLHPGVEQLCAAIDALWYPFKDFPFVGPIDRGVMLAALLTATLRAVLPTAPGFLFTAPSAGSGKSLLATCLSILAGADPASLMPPTLEEEELRKRLLAALREGKPALVFDNIAGQLDSAALCAYLTAREYGDRVLGASVTISVPATGLFLATGNNVALVGDLNRRLLTCRIDPHSDKPYRRAFALDPERYVRDHRQALVRHALVLVRGYLSTGTPVTPDRTASFEDWSDLVRQTVLWVGRQGLLDVADPCDAIDTSYEEDPETRKLGGLLSCWHAIFGDKPKSVAEAITLATDPVVSGRVSSDSDRGRLQDVLMEIAGEHGRINSRRLGRWIERMAGRICEGLRIERGGRANGVSKWRVKPAEGGFGG